MAKSGAQRMREMRARAKLSAEERQARHVSRKIVTELYHSTDQALARIKARVCIDEDQDIQTRLIHGADKLDVVTLRKLLGLS